MTAGARPVASPDRAARLASGLAPLPEERLPPGSVLVADLHLDVGERRSVEPFLAFLARRPAPPLLAVLGDLFDVWVGPAQAGLGEAPAVLAALRGLSAGGTRVLVVPGNRDFLLDASFERASGAVLHAEGFVGLAPDGRRVACVHGDTLCTLDRGYQRLRRALRLLPMRWLSRHVPLPIARAIARRLRRASTRAIAVKPAAEKSVQPAAAAALARAQRADCVVAGHAHAFRDERLPDGARWIVLDAFGGARDVLVFDADGPHTLAGGAPAA